MNHARHPDRIVQPPCVLCGADATYLMDCDGGPYFRCRACQLVFLSRGCLLSAAAEKAEYDRHENAVDDPGYRRFLSRSFDEVRRRMPLPAVGLDFGCGPGPALATMAREAGYAVDVYDPFYADDRAVFIRCYDFITATEVVEHLACPREELECLWSLLRPGGVLVIQTQRVLSDTRFRDWRYRADPTHITFFARESFTWLAACWEAAVDFPHRDVVVFGKP